MNASAPLDSLLQIATTIEAEEERACSKLRMLAGELFNMRMFTNSLSITVDNTMTHLEGRCMSHGRKQAGEVARPETLLFFLGFVIILILDYFQVTGSIILGILSISGLSLALGLTSWHGVISLPPSMAPTFLKLDFSGMTELSAIKATFTFF